MLLVVASMRYRVQPLLLVVVVNKVQGTAATCCCVNKVQGTAIATCCCVNKVQGTAVATCCCVNEVQGTAVASIRYRVQPLLLVVAQ